jgi:hypothetical protein
LCWPVGGGGGAGRRGKEKKEKKKKKQQGICRWDFVVKNMMMSTNSLLSF